MFPKDLSDKRVTVMGLGAFGGGLAAARFAAQAGAKLTVTDLRSADELTDAVATLRTDKIEAQLFLGGHPDAAFDDCDLLICNPAIKPDNRHVQSCQSKGIPVTSEIEMFVRNNRATTIAVTGTNGKSTTTQLIADLLRQNLPPSQRVLTGGNIGNSLLPELDTISERDYVILELSSFQLHQLRHTAFRPDVAVVTNVTANHLDWHPDFAHYRSSKQILTQAQRQTDTMVLPADLDEWPGRARCLRFGLQDNGEDGVYFEDGCLVVRMAESESAERTTLSQSLNGTHNLCNVAAAVAATSAVLGNRFPDMSALLKFRGLPHRMQLVARGAQRSFISDSGSTTPESTIAALQSLSSPCVLIAGGGDKGVDLSELCRQISERCKAFVAIGATAQAMTASLQNLLNQSPCRISAASDNFESAFEQAVALTDPGDIVLLSPGCTSHGWFANYRERGEIFTQLAQDWCNRQKETQ